MACRGVHFAITDDVATRLLQASGDEEVRALVEEIEKAWDEEHLAESDKSWDAMHRCLTDGRLLYENGEYPLNRCVLGGRQLYQGDEYIVSLVTPAEVRDLAQALSPLTREWLRARYFGILPRDYAPEFGEDDFEYTWSNLEDVRKLYLKAAEEGRTVIFTVDQ